MSDAGERPMRPMLTREHILRTALALIDRDGLDAFTMRRLGAELGVDPMAVYRHLPNKGAVLDGVVELLWASGLGLEGIDPKLGWRAAIASAMRNMRQELLAHPRAVALVATHPLATSEEQYAFLERVLELLEQTGVKVDSELLVLINVVGVYTLGHVTAEVAEPAGGAGGEIDEQRLSVLSEEYPRLAALLGGPGLLGYEPDAQFERGLGVILAGWGSAG